MTADPILYVLLYSTFAALVAAFGAVPYPGKGKPRLVASATALASGFMLGAAYLLMVAALDRHTIGALVGAVLGVSYTWSSQWYAGTRAVEDPEATPGSDVIYKLLIQRTMHSASEGVAIGVAMALELRMGIFVALALALHNIAEAVSLADI